MKRTILIAIFAGMAAAPFGLAATIPAGTPLYAKTTAPISSHERAGAPIKAELEKDVVVKGKVLLPAGTMASGVVVSSLRRPQSAPVTVNLTSVLVGGKSIPIKTTGACRLDRFTTNRGVSVSGREWNFPYHTRVAFQLAEPINL